MNLWIVMGFLLEEVKILRKMGWTSLPPKHVHCAKCKITRSGEKSGDGNWRSWEGTWNVSTANSSGLGWEGQEQRPHKGSECTSLNCPRMSMYTYVQLGYSHFFPLLSLLLHSAQTQASFHKREKKRKLSKPSLNGDQSHIRQLPS